ncbi:hypothetical protein [Massilia phyllosphaerae]|uniref:hypothetical protein n=1 Tax=Massilia phyllosphaerae TaxID=3106034 RepID=UPI002B1CE0D8|nr:hypothetical protein [Massilia sp. SGZ-792]
MHTYTRFRIRLTLQTLAQLTARLRSSGEIVVLALGQALLGLLAVAALPPMYFTSYPPATALGLLVLHALAMSLPVALLRPRILPAAVQAWLAPLPVPPTLLLRASLLVSGLLLAPLALAYAASLAIWLLQHARPAWLLPLRAVAGTLLSFLLTWACACGLLVHGALRPPAPPRASSSASAARYAARPRPGWRFLWHHLFWLPLWRQGSLAGLRQAALLGGTVLAAALWMAGPALLPRPAGAIMASVLLVLLVHEADDALRSQLARLHAATAGLPLMAGTLGWRARVTLLATLAPPLLALTAGGLAAGAWTHTAGYAWLALAWMVAPLLVCTPPFTPRGRMALVAFFMLVLCATGSRIWN